MRKGILVALAGVLILIIAALGWLALHFHASAITEQSKVSQLTSDNALQTQTIATQSLTFQKFNQLAAASQQYGVQVASQSEERVIEYRTILKKQNVPTCDLSVPADVADGLLNYANRLRSGAMPGAVADADRAGTGSAAASTLTYCQAVMWIDPLLTTIDKANDQLAKIRAEDAQRTGNVGTPSP